MIDEEPLEVAKPPRGCDGTNTRGQTSGGLERSAAALELRPGNGVALDFRMDDSAIE